MVEFALRFADDTRVQALLEPELVRFVDDVVLVPGCTCSQCGHMDPERVACELEEKVHYMTRLVPEYERYAVRRRILGRLAVLRWLSERRRVWLYTVLIAGSFGLWKYDSEVSVEAERLNVMPFEPYIIKKAFGEMAVAAADEAIRGAVTPA